MTRSHGYAPRGQRLRATTPQGHWKTTTLVGGLTARRIIAPMVRDGPMDTAALTACVEHASAKEQRPGGVVILDNLRAYKTACVREAFQRCHMGYLYQPPYSPDLNPIENAFSN